MRLLKINYIYKTYSAVLPIIIQWDGSTGIFIPWVSGDSSEDTAEKPTAGYTKCINDRVLLLCLV